MGKTYKDKKITQGMLQKIKNEEEKKIKKLAELEAIEAAKWHDPKKLNRIDIKREKEKERKRKKEENKLLYEKELEEITKKNT
ncbi:hypothetical protein NUSPORA_00824 [Nucleospora cyclopteri]